MSGGVDFSTYSSTLSKSGVVVLGKPQTSSLYTEVASGGMPDGGPVLSTDEVTAISDWIVAGAPNGDFPSTRVPVPGPTPIVNNPAPPPAPTPVVSATPPPTPGMIVKYSQLQAKIFDQACVRCHSGSTPKGKVNLSSFAALMASAKRNLIIAGSPDTSLVYTEISSGDMPPSGPPIAAPEVALLREWINQGARGDQ